MEQSYKLRRRKYWRKSMKNLIWSVAWGNYRYMLQSLVQSIVDCNINADIIVFCDQNLKGCKTIPMDNKVHLDQTQFWKFEYLQKVASLGYENLIFIDSDHYFVRKPNISFDETIGEDVWHSFLESPINSGETKRSDWWGARGEEMTSIWRVFGVTQNIVYNTNGGFFICKSKFAKAAKEAAFSFRDFHKKLNYHFPEEVSIAVISHMFSKEYQNRFHHKYLDLWGSEWTGELKDKIPDGKPWKHVEYMTGKESLINPAIVHAMRSKTTLSDMGKNILLS